MTEQPLVQFRPEDLQRIQMQAQAIELERKRAGVWSGGIRPHIEYQTRPLAWITEKLLVPEHTLRWSLNPGYDTGHQWDGDEDPIIKIIETIGQGLNCCVESATGTGKTFTAACLALWFEACFENALVITSAPKGENLLAQIWREIGALWPQFKLHFPQAELLTGKLRMRAGEEEKEAWTAMAFVAGVGADEEAAQKAAGFHRRDMFIITEDTPGMDTAIMTAFAHTRTGDHNLQLSLGNPDDRNDSLHRFGFDESEQPRPGVVHVRISALDHPNMVSGLDIVPGAIGPKRLEQRIAEYGVGTRLYESRIRGICPAESEEALVKWEWCVAASRRWDDPAYREGEPALGVDVADSPTGDDAAIADFQGRCCLEVPSWKVKTNAEEVADKVALLARAPLRPINARHIGVDNIGVGASCYNRLLRLGIRARKITGSGRTVPLLVAAPGEAPASQGDEHKPAPGPTFVIESEQYDSQRSQVLWRAREDIRLLNVALPKDEKLWRELCALRYKTQGGKICVEPKEKVIDRLGWSPNKADAFAYGNFVRPRRAPRKREEPPVVDRRQQDVGLERIFGMHHQREQAELRSFRRAMASRARARRRRLP